LTSAYFLVMPSRNLILTLLISILWIALAPYALAQDNAYLAELVAQARSRHLADRPEWRDLLHYKPYPYRAGMRSLADDPAFFNAPDGKTHPQHELEATLAVFFSNKAESDKEQNPQCSFPARYDWLKKELAFDSTRLPVHECKRFNQWYTALNPQGITLVFPSAYINNPASMYGHTLLRVDAKDQDEHTRLLAYSISYAAATNETSGLIFAVKGLFGGYPGTFAITPYYMKVREYSDIENRDVWEYELTLTPDEIDRLLKHVWELGPIRFDYYFFDENCAYHLLSVLDVARPGLHLTDQFRWWAIPSDTVRAVSEVPGLVNKVVYRPATATLIEARVHAMDKPLALLARDVVLRSAPLDDARLTQLAPPQAAAAVELAYDYATYRGVSGAPGGESFMRDLLLARSHVDVPTTAPAVPIPAVRPDQGHASSRLLLGAGSRDGDAYQEVRYRPTYHDLLDDDGGYTRGAQIQFFDTRLRHYQDHDGVRLEEFIPLDIMSVTPRDDFFTPHSWRLSAGWTRKRYTDDDQPLVAHLDGGPGLAWNLIHAPGGYAVAFGLLEASFQAHHNYTDGYALGGGAKLGVLADLNSRWRIKLYASALHYGLGDDHDETDITLEQRIGLGRNNGLWIDLKREGQFGRYWNSAGLSFGWYF
jgi:hypothetical protein